MNDYIESESELLLHLAEPVDRLAIGRHSGPGLRLIFWVQGCSLLCTRKCLNPHLLKQGGYAVKPSQLTEILLRFSRDYSEIEGITVLGGEPFDQASALAEALDPAASEGLSIMIYTGHTLESLRDSPDRANAQLLAMCDILVDGPFIDELYDESLIWRGSQNQRVLLLSDYYSEKDIEMAISNQKRALVLSISTRGDWAVSGAQSRQIARRLTRYESEIG
jgi:anaerobic ribonucleoside-triphosphate reductase activating protein